MLLDTGGVGEFGRSMLELTIMRKDGVSIVKDGPFAETKELVGGFALMEVKDRDDAIAWTNRYLDVLGGNATVHIHEVLPALA